MNPRSLLLALLVVAAISVDAALARAALSDPFPSLPATFLLGLALAQIGLLAAWLAAGPGNLAIRYGACLVGIVGLARPLSLVTIPNLPEWMGILGLCATAIAVPVFLWRWIARKRPHGQTTRPAPTLSRLVQGQWTLAGIFSVTTLVAISLALSRRVDFPRGDLVAVLVTCVGFSITTLVSLAAARHVRTRMWPMAAVVLICPLAGAAVGGLIGSTRDAVVMAAVAFVQSLAVLFVLAVLNTRRDRQTNPAELPSRLA